MSIYSPFLTYQRIFKSKADSRDRGKKLFTIHISFKELTFRMCDFYYKKFINKKANNPIFKIRQNVSLTDISLKNIHRWQINT